MYRLSLFLFVVVTVLVRFCFLNDYPVGFSSHTVVHAKIRARMYETIYLSPWTQQGWKNLSDLLLHDHHGPQSFLEAIFVPIFGFGSSESRMIISVLGLVSVALIVLWGTVGINKWFGLILGLTVGLAPYGLYFSRYGDSEHVNIYWHAFLLLFACQRVITRGYVRDYALMGVAAGLSLYVYATNPLLCALSIPIVLLFKALQWRSGQRSWWLASILKGAVFCSLAWAIAYPLMVQYIRIGRFVPARSPLANSDQMGSAMSVLPQKFAGVWKELFVAGGDPWFSRRVGCINDWDLWLLIPGVIMMFIMIRASQADVRSAAGDVHALHAAKTKAYSLSFFCLITLLIVVCGVLPGVLSPEASFRRIVLTAIGLDIIQAFGLYGIICLVFRGFPTVPAQLVTLAVLAGFAVGQWNTFFYASFSHDSNSSNSVVSVVREVKRKVRAGEEAFVLMPDRPQILRREEGIMWINYEFGFPKELPPNVAILEIQDLSTGSRSDVIVPIDAARKVLDGQFQLPPGVTATNVRRFSNRGGETYALIDFQVAGQGASVPLPDTKAVTK